MRLAYELHGPADGRAVVLLHPFPFDRRFFRDCALVQGEHHRIVVPDLRGFGESALPEGGFSVADLADDLAELLDTLRIERAVVGGLSLGGYVALALAARHRHRLSGLILADTKASADPEAARLARADSIALVRTAGVSAYVDKQLPRLVAASASDELRAQVRMLAAQPAAAVVAGLEALRDRPDRTAELPAVTCPTMIIVGSEDVLTPPAEAEAMSAAIKGALLVCIPGAGHLTSLEAPLAFNTAVAAFLGDH